MSMLSRRLQILIDDGRLRRLEREAARRGVAVSVLVREAIDVTYPVDTSTRRSAAHRVLDADPMPVPDVASLREELDDLRGRRA